MNESNLRISPYKVHSTRARKKPAAGLETFNGVWDKTTAAHLVRRTHFGNRISDLNFVRSFNTAELAVDELVNRASAVPLPDDPNWFKNGNSGNIQDFYDIQWSWMDRMYSGGLLERMMLFWSNHFVVGYNTVSGKASGSYANHMQNYMKLLHTDSFGNFKDLVYKISVNPAMLYYLNGYVNDQAEPNEDFGRELLELFTLGLEDKNGNPNYTDQDSPPGDVQEVARASTGWRVNNNTLNAFFNTDSFDSGSKTVLGQTGNHNLQDVVNIIFDQKPNEVAWFICRKLYTFFVSAEPNLTIIDELATFFVQQNFEIAPTLKRLLASAHFYETQFYGSRIKSPVEMYVGFLRETELPPNSNVLEFMRSTMPGINQELLNPPNVAGWPGYNPPGSDSIPGHYTWLNTSVLPTRWTRLEEMVSGNAGANYDPLELAQKISDPADPFALAIDLANHLLAVPLDQVGIRSVEEDFEGGSQPVPDYILAKPDYEQDLIKILLAGTPWYDWGLFYESDTAKKFLRDYITYLFQLPAYQLT